MLNIVIFDPPGSGKGTQSENLIKEYNLAHISTGDLERNSPFRNYLDNGDGEMLEGRFYKKTPTEDRKSVV